VKGTLSGYKFAAYWRIQYGISALWLLNYENAGLSLGCTSETLRCTLICFGRSSRTLKDNSIIIYGTTPSHVPKFIIIYRCSGDEIQSTRIISLRQHRHHITGHSELQPFPPQRTPNANMEDPVNISSSYSGEHSARHDHERTESSSTSPQRRRQRGSAQKTMLSKALAKANTAVLLDNAENFEGAIEAYQDACELLQYVMLRSNGGDVEKYKLLEIVSDTCGTIISWSVLERRFADRTHSAKRTWTAFKNSFGYNSLPIQTKTIQTKTRHCLKGRQAVIALHHRRKNRKLNRTTLMRTAQKNILRDRTVKMMCHRYPAWRPCDCHLYLARSSISRLKNRN